MFYNKNYKIRNQGEVCSSPDCFITLQKNTKPFGPWTQEWGLVLNRVFKRGHTILTKALTQAVTLWWRHKACKVVSEGILALSGLLSHSGKLGCIFQHTFETVSLILLKLNPIQHHKQNPFAIAECSMHVHIWFPDENINPRCSENSTWLENQNIILKWHFWILSLSRKGILSQISSLQIWEQLRVLLLRAYLKLIKELCKFIPKNVIGVGFDRPFS